KLAEFRTAFGDGLGHLAEDVQTAAFRLVQGDLHDLFGDTVDLDVHLERSDAGFRTRDLEVHIAEVIFVTEDVGQDGEALVFLDQAHGDAGNGLGQRNAGIHEGERRAANGRHGGRAVRLGDLRDDAQRVRELFGG